MKPNILLRSCLLPVVLLAVASCGATSQKAAVPSAPPSPVADDWATELGKLLCKLSADEFKQLTDILISGLQQQWEDKRKAGARKEELNNIAQTIENLKAAKEAAIRDLGNSKSVFLKAYQTYLAGLGHGAAKKVAEIIMPMLDLYKKLLKRDPRAFKAVWQVLKKLAELAGVGADLLKEIQVEVDKIK